MAEITELQRDVLTCLDTTWLRPMDLGGRDGSHHSAVLAALVRKGLAERAPRSGVWNLARGSYVYRITDAGLAALGRTTSGASTGGES